MLVIQIQVIVDEVDLSQFDNFNRDIQGDGNEDLLESRT